jgi:hypothetical protein
LDLAFVEGPQVPSSCYANNNGYTASRCAKRPALTDFHQNSTGILSSWDFAGENTNGTNDYWQFPAGGGLPTHGTIKQVRITTPASIEVTAANQATFALAGTCTVDGANILTIGGVISGTTNCTGGTFSLSLDLSAINYGPVMVTVQYSNAPPDIITLNKNKQ